MIHGYTAVERETILAAKGWPRQPFCCVTGRTDEPIQMHHVLASSLNPGTRGTEDEGPMLPLSETTHGYCKGSHVKFMPSGDGKWSWMPLTDEFCEYVATWRRMSNLYSRIEVGHWYACTKYDEAVQEALERDREWEELAAIASERIRSRRHSVAQAWREDVEDAATVYAADPHGDRFRAWREDEGISGGEWSRMKAVAAHLEPDELRDAPASMQYEAARAVHRRPDDREQIIADAEALSVTDFRARWWPAKGKPDKERCPSCGLLVDPKRLHSDGGGDNG